MPAKSKYFSPGSRGWWTERCFCQLYVLKRSSQEPGLSIDSRGKQRQTGSTVSPLPWMPAFRWDGCGPCCALCPSIARSDFWGILPSRKCPKLNFLQHDGAENSENVDSHKQELQQRLLWNVSRLFSQIQDRPLLAVRASCPGRAKAHKDTAPGDFCLPGMDRTEPSLSSTEYPWFPLQTYWVLELNAWGGRNTARVTKWIVKSACLVADKRQIWFYLFSVKWKLWRWTNS